jgi:dCMP deaminase
MPSAIANREVDCDFKISSQDLFLLGLKEVHDRAFAEAQKSSDWWRQVGAVLFREKEILLAAFNRHLPTEYETEFEGDPRSNFQAGEYIEFSSAIHGEAGLIGAAASRGICTRGLEIFATTFPCPACAALIATSGLKRLYFVEGYSNVNALATLREYGVEIVQVV